MTEQRLQRRLAAIMAADVVGYTRLMDLDEAGTLARLQALRRAVFDPRTKAYGWRIFKTTGDGALAEFPSATDAVQCALDIQRELAAQNESLPEAQRVVLRVGISLGDVIVDGDDLYGNGVNVAARMEALAQPGDICVSANVHEHVAGAVNASFEDLGEQTVKNLPRPVRCYRLATAASAAEPTLPESQPLALPDKPSIAVLPFQNMSGDPEQEFFADGMTEDIITALSRYRSLFVIARNSTFAYKGQSPDLRQVSTELGVRYVLEGSIRKAGQRIRVTAQLIEGTSGAHIWAERYDRQLDDIFELQDEITGTITAAIGPEIDQAERDRAQRLPPESLDVWELYQKGLWHLYRFNAADNAEAQRLFRRAMQSSPSFAPAAAGLGYALYYSFMHGHQTNRAEILDALYTVARQAVLIDSRDADAHLVLSRALWLRREYSASISECLKAVSENPNMAHAYVGLATAYIFSGQAEHTLESAEKAARLSPHDPTSWIIDSIRAMAMVISHRFADAETAATQALAHPTAQITVHFIHTASVAHQGKVEAARQALAALYQLKPDVSASDVAAAFPFEDPEHLNLVLEGLYKAGMPRPD